MAKKVYFVIAQKGFRDEELIEPLDLVKSAGFETIILSPKKGTCIGSQGVKIESDFAISDVGIDEDLRAVVVVGGEGSLDLMAVSELGELLFKAIELKKVIGAICLGPMVVASFGLLKGKYATVFPTEESLDMFKNKGIEYVKEDIVVDELLVTANGPHAASAFAHNFIEVISDSLVVKLKK